MYATESLKRSGNIFDTVIDLTTTNISLTLKVFQIIEVRKHFDEI